MQKAWKEIKRLVEINAKHMKKRKRLGDYKSEDILKHTAEEVVELSCNENKIEEVADILGCLIHYCVRKRWSEERLEKELLKKLKERFDG